MLPSGCVTRSCSYTCSKWCCETIGEDSCGSRPAVGSWFSANFNEPPRLAPPGAGLPCACGTDVATAGALVGAAAATAGALVGAAAWAGAVVGAAGLAAGGVVGLADGAGDAHAWSNPAATSPEARASECFR